MQLYPAIDLKDGKCVRLRQGEFKDVTVYSEEPYKVAKYFEDMGASFIHLVDLDGALAGKAVNEDTIKKIVKEVTIPCELGGGIRTFEDIERVLSYGIYRVIIGTKAVNEPEFVKAAVEKFGAEHIVVGVDAKDGMVAIQGWEQVSSIKALDLCLKMKAYGVRTIVYTDIAKDGMLSGPNVAMTKELTVVADPSMIRIATSSSWRKPSATPSGRNSAHPPTSFRNAAPKTAFFLPSA